MINIQSLKNKKIIFVFKIECKEKKEKLKRYYRKIKIRKQMVINRPSKKMIKISNIKRKNIYIKNLFPKKTLKIIIFQSLQYYYSKNN